jgi:hypothetical protein
MHEGLFLSVLFVAIVAVILPVWLMIVHERDHH